MGILSWAVEYAQGNTKSAYSMSHPFVKRDGLNMNQTKALPFHKQDVWCRDCVKHMRAHDPKWADFDPN